MEAGMTVDIEGVTLHLAHPDELAIQWVGQDELMRQLLAAWMVVNDQDRGAHRAIVSPRRRVASPASSPTPRSP